MDKPFKEKGENSAVSDPNAESLQDKTQTQDSPGPNLTTVDNELPGFDLPEYEDASPFGGQDEDPKLFTITEADVADEDMPHSAEFAEVGNLQETTTAEMSQFDLPTSDTEQQNLDFIDESPSDNEGEETDGLGDIPSGAALPGEMTEEQELEDKEFQDFVMPPSTRYQPEGEDEGEMDDVFAYTPYELPPDKEKEVDDIVVNYLYKSDEFDGEDMQGENPLPPQGESNLSVRDLDEMIRILQGDKDGRAGREAEGNEEDPGESFEETSDAPLRTEQEHEHDNLMVLGPNHPKMQRFQEALRQHLERQMYQATCEARDYDNELKTLRREREDAGQQLYNLQYELQRQSEHLSKLESQLEHVHRQRADRESSNEIQERELKEANSNLLKELDIEAEMIHAIKEMDMMEWCIRQTDADYEGEAKIQGHLDEQFQRVKTKTELEKRDQDFYLDKMLTHVQHMEQANSGIQRQIQAHLDEQKDLNTAINEAGTEIEVIQIEKHHLSKAWNETISVVRARDEALRAARDTLQSSKEELRNREAELRSIRREITKEQEHHEEKTVLVKRRKMEERIAQAQLKALQAQLAELEAQLGFFNHVKTQLESEYVKACALLARKEREIQQPRKHLEQLCVEKARLEDLILFQMQEHDAADKITVGMAKKVQQARERSRTAEAEVAKVENDMTNLTITVEKLRTDLLKRTSALEEMDKKLKSQEKVLQGQALDMKQSEKMVQKKTCELQQATRKLNTLIVEHGGIEVGPVEIEIDELEKQIAFHRSVCVDLQAQWLTLQDELVRLTSQRDAILAQNELIRKEAFIMERKKQRLDTEVEAKRIATEKTKKQIESLQAEIQICNSKLYEGRVEESQLDKDNVLIQNEFMSLLKDAETEAVELQQEIANLEEEKESLTLALTEGHEMCLWWEKKVKLAKELRDSIKDEQENSTSGLKLAIHHMQVRYQELMRVQEKLMGDLERSIDRRDRIITQADHDLRRANIDPNRTKLNIQRNLESIQEKNRQVLREAIEAEKEVADMQLKISTLEGKLKCESEALRRIRDMITVADEKIADATVEKHKDMIELFLRQQKYKLLESISMSRYKPAHTQEDIEILCQESEELCYELAELCEILIHQYPELSLPIRLVKASIFTSPHKSGPIA